MNCRRCGKANPASARHCVHCGNPLSVKSGNQADNIIVAIIVVLIVVLIVAAGVLLWQKNSPNKGFKGGGGGGGGSISHPIEEKPIPSQEDIPGMILPDKEKETEEEKRRKEEEERRKEEEEKRIEKEKEAERERKRKEEEESARKAEEAENDRFAQKDAFISEAARIQDYEDSFLDNAETDSAKEQEAKNVYNKWDSLLNKVYNYLETILSDSEFASLEDDELGWIEQKEADMAHNRELNGKTAEYLVGIDYTKARTYYLISRVK